MEAEGLEVQSQPGLHETLFPKIKKEGKKKEQAGRQMVTERTSGSLSALKARTGLGLGL